MVSFGVHFSCSSMTGKGWAELYADAIEQSVVAERLGFECAVVAEHHFKADGWIPAPLLLCSAIAARTSTIKIGPDILVLPFQNPITVAEQLLVLDNLSRGRVVAGLGVGAQESEYNVLGVPYRSRFRQTEEALALVRRLVEETCVTHRGEFFEVNDLTVWPRAYTDPGPALWYGATSEAGGRRAARLADALVIGPAMDVNTLCRIRTAYLEECERLDVPIRRRRIVLRREAHIAESDNVAWREAFEPMRFQYSQVYTKIDGASSVDEVRQYAADRFIVGGPDEAAAQTGRFAEASGADLVIVRLQLPGLSHGQILRSLELLGTEVAGAVT